MKRQVHSMVVALLVVLGARGYSAEVGEDQAAIAALKKLGGDVTPTSVSFRDAKIADADLRHLQALPRVTKVSLIGCTNVTEAGLTHLRGMKELTTLYLPRTSVGNSGLEQLKGMTKLANLYLSETKVGDAGLKHLTEIGSLRVLYLDGLKVSDAGVKHLTGLDKLVTLSLNGTKVTDDGLKDIAGLAKLAYLHLNDTAVTDAGLERLKGLSSLVHLDLKGTKVTDTGIKRLREALPKCEIIHAKARSATSAKRAVDDNLVVNGSFERRSEGEPNINIESLAKGSKTLLGWDVIESTRESKKPSEDGLRDEAPGISNVDWIGPERWTASHGKHCLDLDGGVRQAVPTKPGQRYVLQFDLAGNPEAEPMVQHLRVMLGEKAHEFDFNSKGRNERDLGWVTKQIEFAAVGEGTVLSFINAKPNAQSAGVALDNVAVRAIKAATGDRIQDMHLRIRRLSENPKQLRREGRTVEAQRQAERAASVRKEFEELLGVPDADRKY